MKKKNLRNKKVGVRFDSGREEKDTLHSTLSLPNDLTTNDIDVLECFDSEDDLDFEESLIEENL